ncbi:MAG: DEAD/DEAH box helicase family protein [Bacteroidia bacterium]|nr:DEAD/DEAH box helicase family protein [Bacteroidia bacterium]
MNLYLQNIVEYIPFSSLTTYWQDVDLHTFSIDIELHGYQQKGLENAIKALHLYYEKLNQDKKQLFNYYKNNGLSENLDLIFKDKDAHKYKVFNEYSTEFPIERNSIPFWSFINRMSFWMATGSGKTVILIKLISILGQLMKEGTIPKQDILFLTCREDLIEQFKAHIQKFNEYPGNLHIHCYSLKEYDSIKQQNNPSKPKQIDVFYYRSDLVSDIQKDKIIDFRNYENQGKWYILLDEAHKGDKEESKRQFYYSIMARKGFMFNFSATFTDKIDFATCVFNFNLERLIQNGYGKKIFISQADISALENKNKEEEFSAQKKQEIILKVFILHTYLRKLKNEVGDLYYHNPLIVTLVNSVNTEDSDLYMLFKLVEDVALHKVSAEVLESAKKSLISDLRSGTYQFDRSPFVVDENRIYSIDLKDILENVLNAKIHGNIEVLKIPGNKKEIAFKLTTSDVPFALIKIGDITEWIKNKLKDYVITERVENESLFRKINDRRSEIQILMGSRTFYEGWDSDRPNILLYVNIGKGKDAQKFVLQSIGRGVRICPFAPYRMRLRILQQNKMVQNDLFEYLNLYAQPLESLFVYGTKANNLIEVVNALKIYTGECMLLSFEVNPDIQKEELLIPTYTKIVLNEPVPSGILSTYFLIHSEDLALLENYCNYLGKKILLAKFDLTLPLVQKLFEALNHKQKYFKVNNAETYKIQVPEKLVSKVIQFLKLQTEVLREFKPLEEEIVHFKYICANVNVSRRLRELIDKVKKYPIKPEALQILDEQFDKGEISRQDYIHNIKKLESEYPQQIEAPPLVIRYVDHHYYVPLCLSDDEKVDYIKHIIKTKSEFRFIQDLEHYLSCQDNLFNQLDKWYFSKIDETLDSVYIPYYEPKSNSIQKFKPDFIFWLWKGKEYTILFIDPKGTEHTAAYRKIDGYKKLFEFDNKPKIFEFNGYQVKVLLKCRTEDILAVPNEYAPYWFEDIKDMLAWTSEPHTNL